jgi:hypothetical protein
MSPLRAALVAAAMLIGCGRKDHDASSSPPLAVVDARPPRAITVRRVECAEVRAASLRDGSTPVRVAIDSGGGATLELFAAPAAGGLVCAVATIQTMEGEPRGTLLAGSAIVSSVRHVHEKTLDAPAPPQLLAFFLHDEAWERAVAKAADDVARAKGKERDALCDAARALAPPDASSLQDRADAILEKYLADGLAPEVVAEAGVSDVVELRIRDLRQQCELADAPASL